MDWDFVQWLLENDAEPAVDITSSFPPELIYSIGKSEAEIDKMYQDMIKKVRAEYE